MNLTLFDFILVFIILDLDEGMLCHVIYDGHLSQSGHSYISHVIKKNIEGCRINDVI